METVWLQLNCGLIILLLPGWYFSNKQWSIPRSSNDESVLYLGDGNGNVAALNTTLGTDNWGARFRFRRFEATLPSERTTTPTSPLPTGESLLLRTTEPLQLSWEALGRWIELHPPVPSSMHPIKWSSPQMTAGYSLLMEQTQVPGATTPI